MFWGLIKVIKLLKKIRRWWLDNKNICYVRLLNSLHDIIVMSCWLSAVFERLINNSRWPLWTEAPGPVAQASVSSWSIPVCRKSKALTVQCPQVWLWFKNGDATGMGVLTSYSARKKSLRYLVLWKIHLWNHYCELNVIIAAEVYIYAHGNWWCEKYCLRCVAENNWFKSNTDEALNPAVMC